MAKAYTKRVSGSNATTLLYLIIFLVTTWSLHLLSLLVLSSPSPKRQAWRFSLSTVVTFGAYLSLYVGGSPLKDERGRLVRPGDDLGQGLWQYVVDLCIIGGVVWVGAGWISTKFWWLYLSFPAFAIWKIGSLAAPLISHRLGLGSADPARQDQPMAQQQQQSRRQEKLAARSGQLPGGGGMRRR